MEPATETVKDEKADEEFRWRDDLLRAFLAMEDPAVVWEMIEEGFSRSYREGIESAQLVCATVAGKLDSKSEQAVTARIIGEALKGLAEHEAKRRKAKH